MADPVAELVADLRAQRRPDLAWMIRWSDGGRDPIRAAWDVSRDGEAMVTVLALTSPAAFARAVLATVDECVLAYRGEGRFEQGAHGALGALYDAASEMRHKGRAAALEAVRFAFALATPRVRALICAVMPTEARRAAPAPPSLAEVLDAVRGW